MTLAVILTIFASFLWGVTNHIDKFMINNINESGSSIKTLLVFSTLIAGLVISPIWLIISNFSVSISTISLVCILSSSIIYILATYLYYLALEKNDASVIVIMFQLIPVFSYILALIFFNEKLTLEQIIGSIIITLSAILISIDFEEKNNKSKTLALLFVTLSSLSYSVYYILFDIGIRNTSYNSCAFWLQIGFLLQGLVLICIKDFRNTFIDAIKTNGKRYVGLNITNESLNLIAVLIVNFANVTIPLAIVNVLNGFQGAFVFILGVLGIKLLPKYFKENINKKEVIQKVSCIILSIIGLIIMFF